MAAPQNFRSAFNGFNRQDVVHYLEYINTKHQDQINSLTAETEDLHRQLEELQAQAAQIAELEARLAAMTEERDAGLPSGKRRAERSHCQGGHRHC